MTSASLGVDGLNPNQAMTLYTSLGFEVATTGYDWTKSLPADAAPPLDPTEIRMSDVTRRPARRPGSTWPDRRPSTACASVGPA